ncbi:hypothetical protein ES332_A07G091900v1 [Gossypium tomentosum]|uniref:DUF4408 domain-containing protein n=1 Tax=Gossypium tomentosum TaxID=34277 RepID=A0A5D2PQ33_GOSTO|nr:hypothetical protein ES332_A07G091900v1 [Gossypium tomentosum]
MLHIRFIDIILWVFLVLYTLKNSSMHSHQGDESKEYVVSVRKEFDEGFRERKMGGHEVGVDSKNSGGNNDAEIMSTQKFHDQASNQYIQVEGHSKAKPSLKNLSSRLDNDEPTVMGNTIESKRLSEVDAKEVINLMNKDYKGFDQPRQKPPINNHVPKH